MKFTLIYITLILLVWSCQSNTQNVDNQIVNLPIVVSTWPNILANEEAYSALENDGSAIDAIEQGIRIKETDVEDESVGIGGLPDAAGEVTLDACIMDSNGNAGSVTFLKDILHPISVARMIMDETPHVMLSGEGALQFALEKGFKRTRLLTENASKKWSDWKEGNREKKADNHDTIGMLAIDKKGNISGGCSTSGMAYKLPGRVGDSPIIGSGLFIDNEIGGATATGVGEEVMKTVGSFLVVELMRSGLSPQEACKEAVRRIVEKNDSLDFQVGYIAINKMGQVGAFCVQDGFEYTVTYEGQSAVNKSLSYSD